MLHIQFHFWYIHVHQDVKKTGNIEAYVEWFNRLSYLVATEICVVSLEATPTSDTPLC